MSIAEDAPGNGSVDPVLARLTEEITRRFQSGDTDDIDELIATYPHWAGTLRRLVPTIHDLTNLGRSVSRSGSDRLPGSSDPFA